MKFVPTYAEYILHCRVLRTEELLLELGVMPDWTPHCKDSHTTMPLTDVCNIHFELGHGSLRSQERDSCHITTRDIVAVVPSKLKLCVLHTRRQNDVADFSLANQCTEKQLPLTDIPSPN